jgi:hypothetical protein
MKTTIDIENKMMNDCNPEKSKKVKNKILSSPFKISKIESIDNSNASTGSEITNGINNMNIDTIGNEKKKFKINDQKNEFPCEPNNPKFYIKREDQVLIHNYGPELYEFSKDLEEEGISSEYMKRHKFDASVRTKMVDWMIEVLYAYNSDPPTLFLAVEIMDNFISHSKNILTNQDIHLTGICCIYIASKMEDIIPLRMSHVKTKIGHNKFSEKEIKKREKLILETVNFNVITTSTYEFIKTFIYDFNHNNREFIKSLNMSHHVDTYENICVFLSKMMCHTEEFTPFSYSLKAIACIVAAFDILRSNSKDFQKDAENFMRQWVKLLS